MRFQVVLVLLCIFLVSCAGGTETQILRQEGMFSWNTEPVSDPVSVGMAAESGKEMSGIVPETESAEGMTGTVPETPEMIPGDSRTLAGELLSDPDFLAAADAFGGRDDPAAVLAAYLSLYGTPSDPAAVRSMPDGTGGEAEDGFTVYYTAGGGVWHLREDCPALAGAKSVLSGSVQEAKNAGKSRVCKRCGES